MGERHLDSYERTAHLMAIAPAYMIANRVTRPCPAVRSEDQQSTR